MKTTIEEVKVIVLNFMKDNNLQYCEMKLEHNESEDLVFGSVYTEDRVNKENDELKRLLGDE